MLTKDYLAWNQVLFEKFYSESSAGMPVYLDLEDSVLEEFAAHPLLEGAGSIDDLVHAVRNNIDFSLNKDQVFLKIENVTLAWIRTFWREQGDAVPPMLPLLALTVLAAERMGGDGAASNAYYTHFNDILGLTNPKQQESAQESYRKTVIFLWKALNRWLTDRQGLNGEYTAYSLSYAHIGAAMSQALIRDVDRKKLPRMFDYLRLEPGSQVSIPDMKELFSVWLTKDEGGVSQSLRNLWTRESSRNGIAEVLCAELSKWDGSTSNKSAGDSSRSNAIRLPTKLRITLRQSSKLMQKRYEFGVGFNPSNTANIDTKTVNLESNPEVVASVSRKSPGLATLNFPQSLNSENILEGKLDLVGSDGEVLRRLPKNLVLLSRDDDSGFWVEVDRASLGQQLTLLVRLDSNAWQSLLTFLDKNARPGFEFALPSTIGMPKGWGVIERVQIVDVGTVTSATEDLRALVPVSGSQLAFRGGLRLPSTGSFKYWLASKPPIIEAIGQPGQALKLEIVHLDLEADTLIGSSASTLGIVTLDVSALTGAPGNYRATLFEGKAAIAQREFYLRDSKNPDPIASRTKPKLGHLLHHGPFNYVTSSVEIPADENTFVSGLLSTVNLEVSIEDQGSFGTKSSWLPDEFSVSYSANPTPLFPNLDADSCAFTGRHNWELGTCVGSAKYVLGVCKFCGDQKLQMCSAYLAQRAKERGSNVVSSQDLSKSAKSPVPPVIKDEIAEAFNWLATMEILNYCVHGTYSSLIAAIDQLSTEKLSSKQAVVILESRGVIEIMRDELGRPTRWALPEKALIIKEGNNLHLTGHWLRNEIRSISEPLGTVFRHQGANVFPAIFMQLESNSGAIEQLPENYRAHVAIGEFWRALPLLSEVRTSAPREVIAAFDRFDQLDLDSGQWVEPADLRPHPGAFRAMTKLGLRYYYATENDLNNGRAVSNSASLVKWFAANEHGFELLAYVEEDEALYVPLGAQLPPFYARALSTFTCELPKTARTKSGKVLTKYVNVPSIVASALRVTLTS